MNLTLPPRLKQFVAREIKAGRFENTSDAICDGLRLLEKRDAVAMSFRSDFAVLGSIGGSDIVVLVFIVMMEAAKSAEEDLREILKSVKAIDLEECKGYQCRKIRPARSDCEDRL